MTKIINFQENIKKRFFEKALSDMKTTSDSAYDIANSYYQLMQENPSVAINELDNFMEKVRDLNPERSFVEAVAGGPNQDWTAPMIDIVGIVYSTLDADLRYKSLLKCVSFLDQLNYFNAQDNVALINDPWLVSDIVTNRYLYWCGFQEYVALLNKNRQWKDIKEHLDSVKSYFWLSYAIVKPEHSTLDVRFNYYKMFPDLIDKTEDALAAIIYDKAQRHYEHKQIPIEDTIDIRLASIDTLLHDNIRAKINEKKWITLAWRI